jgi:hypothetical protein
MTFRPYPLVWQRCTPTRSEGITKPAYGETGAQVRSSRPSKRTAWARTKNRRLRLPSTQLQDMVCVTSIILSFNRASNSLSHFPALSLHLISSFRFLWIGFRKSQVYGLTLKSKQNRYCTHWLPNLSYLGFLLRSRDFDSSLLHSRLGRLFTIGDGLCSHAYFAFVFLLCSDLFELLLLFLNRS